MQIRIAFEKTDTARFLSHLEMQQMWQRAFRRAGVPMAFSQGFNPHPKISFGSALSVGVESLAEYLDLELKEEVNLSQLKEKINSSLPVGFKVLNVAEIRNSSKPLMAIINRAEYEIRQALESCPENISELAVSFLQEQVINIKRKTKSGLKLKNIRPGIFELKSSCEGSLLKITVMVETGSAGNVKPYEVLNTFLEFAKLKPLGSAKIVRKGLFINRQGKNTTPLEVLEG